MSRYTQDQIAAAAQEALGRDKKSAKAADLYALYKDYKGSLDQLKTDFAGTPEAAKAKVDGTKFGVTYVDPGTLSAEDKRYFDAYQTGSGKGTKLSMASLNYFKQSGTPELLEAQGKGLVTIRESQGAKSITVSKKGWEAYGDKLFERGLQVNDAVLIDKGAASGLADKRLKTYTKVDEKTASKYDVYVKAPRERQGIGGQIAKAAGLSKGTQNSLDKAVGQAALPVTGLMAAAGQGWALALADEAAAIGGGTRGATAYNKAGTGLLRKVGMSDKAADRNFGYINQVGDVSTAIGAGIADFATWGAASAANQGMEALQREQTGQNVDWVNVGKQMALSVATTGALRGLGAGAKRAAEAGSVRTAAKYQTAQNVLQFGGRDAASTAVMGGNKEDIAIAAGRGLVLSALPKDAFTQSSASFTLSYADAKRKGYDSEQAMIQASAAAAASTANALVARGQYAEQAAAGRPDQRTWSGQLQYLKGQVAGVRTAWSRPAPVNPAVKTAPTSTAMLGPLTPRKPSPYQRYVTARPVSNYVERRGVSNVSGT